MSNKNRRNRDVDGEAFRRPRLKDVDTTSWKVRAKAMSLDESTDEDWDAINESVKKNTIRYSRED